MTKLQNELHGAFKNYKNAGVTNDTAAALLVVAETIRRQKPITATGLTQLGNAISLAIQQGLLASSKWSASSNDIQPEPEENSTEVGD